MEMPEELRDMSEINRSQLEESPTRQVLGMFSNKYNNDI